jgi:hypothetical protein
MRNNRQRSPRNRRDPRFSGGGCARQHRFPALRSWSIDMNLHDFGYQEVRKSTPESTREYLDSYSNIVIPDPDPVAVDEHGNVVEKR